MSLFTWFNVGGKKFIINKHGHELTISKNIFNSVNFLKSLNYDFFIFSESDNVLDDLDIIKLNDISEKMITENKKMIFFEPSDFYESNSHVYETLLFAGNPSYFLSKINLPITVNEWSNSGVKTTFERFFFDSFSDDSDNFIVLDVHSSQYFDRSKINLFRNDTFVYDIVYNETNPNTVCFIIKNIIDHSHEKRIILRKNDEIIDDKIIVNGYWEYKVFDLDGSVISITYLIDDEIQDVKTYELAPLNLDLFKSIGTAHPLNPIIDNLTSIDVVCLSKTSNDDLYTMTRNCITSLHNSEDDYKFNIHIIESDFNSQYYYSDICTTYLKPNIKFNYNKFLNISNQFLSKEWVIVINNDVIFEKNWFSKIIDIYNKDNSILSFSPKDPCHFSKYFPGYFNDKNLTHVSGYNISEHVHGWCLVIHKSVWDLVSPFDENFDMYYQDNDYSETIKHHNIKHCIVRDSIVHHLGSKTTDTPFGTNSDEINKSELTFRNKWNIF
jgi:hypothetical protein